MINTVKLSDELLEKVSGGNAFSEYDLDPEELAYYNDLYNKVMQAFQDYRDGKVSAGFVNTLRDELARFCAEMARKYS